MGDTHMSFLSRITDALVGAVEKIVSVATKPLDRITAYIHPKPKAPPQDIEMAVQVLKETFKPLSEESKIIIEEPKSIRYYRTSRVFQYHTSRSVTVELRIWTVTEDPIPNVETTLDNIWWQAQSYCIWNLHVPNDLLMSLQEYESDELNEEIDTDEENVHDWYGYIRFNEKEFEVRI